MFDVPIYLRACRVLSRYAVFTLPVRLSPIFERSGFHLFTYQDYADSLSIRSEQVARQYGPDGFTNYVNGDYMVFYNPSLPPARTRFTLAHELGHIFLGHVGNFAPLSRSSALSQDEEANLFASYLLCPPLLLQACKVGNPKQIAALCDVSMPCAKRAFSVLWQCRHAEHDMLEPEEQELLTLFAPLLSSLILPLEHDESLMPPKHLSLARRL